MWGRRRDARKGAGGRSRKRRPPFWQRLLGASPVIAGSILLTALYGDASLFRKLEGLALAFEMRVSAPTKDDDIVIVPITDADYQNPEYFGGKSPLDPAKLWEAIDKIASARPKVIGVDLDTSAEAFQTFRPAQGWPPVIWARGATYSNVRQKYLLSGALGKNSPAVQYGLVTLKLDSDHTIRRYTRYYNTDVGTASSLPWAMLKKFRGDESPAPAASDFKEEFLIEYPGPAESGYFQIMPLADLYQLSERGQLGPGNPLEGRMVILGGDYEVQDEHATPVGWMNGSQILASIIRTERVGSGRRPIGTAAVVLLAVFDSVVLLLLIHLIGLWKTLLSSVIVVPALAVLLSLLLFGSIGYSGSFMLILIAVLAHQVYERGKDYSKKWREQAAKEIE